MKNNLKKEVLAHFDGTAIMAVGAGVGKQLHSCSRNLR